MSKKGAFIYQQIELTTAEWATNTTVYPASVWLFERLESGKFNMKLADGVHTFAELQAVMQDVVVTVKTNDDTAYILTITTSATSFDTPNLRGKNGTEYDDTAVRNALTALQQQVNALVSGDASTAIESFNEIIEFLASVEDSQTLSGIIAGLNQSIANVQAAIPTIPGVATTTANGLMSSGDKSKLDRVGSYTVSATVANLDVNFDTIYVALTGNASLSASAAGAGYNGKNFTAVVYCATACIITIPTIGDYVSMCGNSFTCPADKWVEFNLTCVDSKWHIAKLEQE